MMHVQLPDTPEWKQKEKLAKELVEWERATFISLGFGILLFLVAPNTKLLVASLPLIAFGVIGLRVMSKLRKRISAE